MKAKIVTFSCHGDSTLLEYDPASADTEEVNSLLLTWTSFSSKSRADGPIS